MIDILVCGRLQRPAFCQMLDTPTTPFTAFASRCMPWLQMLHAATFLSGNALKLSRDTVPVYVLHCEGAGWLLGTF